MNIDKVYKLVEQYLFLFTNADKSKYLLNGIDFSEELEMEEIEAKLLENINRYVHKKLSSGKIAELFTKYIASYGKKKLSSKDFNFYGDLILKSGYECTFEDMDLLYSIPQVKEYIDANPKAKGYLINEINDYLGGFSEDDVVEEEKEEKEETDFIEEKDYAKTFTSTDSYKMYRKDISRYGLLTVEETTDLFIKYRNGDSDAYEKLVLCNQGLVTKVAHRYEGRGLHICELIDEGNIGLMKAIEKFDINKGFRFSTYAIWWIRQSISRAVIDQTGVIRIPVHASEKYFSMIREKNNFETKFGREPTMEELSQITGSTIEQIENMFLANQKIVSLNKPIETGEDADSELGDFIESEDALPDQEVIEEDYHESFMEAIRRVGESGKEREELVLRLRLGKLYYTDEVVRFIKEHNMPDKDKYTLQDIATPFNITRERIRQIEAKGKRYMRRCFEKVNGTYVLKKQIGKK